MRSRFPSLDAAFSDPARVNVLYSPFRSRTLNPDHYDEKMRFWIQVIEEYSTCDRRICLKVADMENTFKADQNQRAACLQEVLRNLIRSGQAVRKDVFLSTLPTSVENSTWFSWTLNQIHRAARKIWNYSPVSMYSSLDSVTPVVYIPQLKLQEKLVQNISTIRNRVMSLEKWKSEVSDKIGLVEDLDLLVEYMKASGKLLTDFVGATEVVKFVATSQNDKCTSISVTEKCEFDVRHTIQILEKDLEHLYEKQKSAEKQARLALREGKRNTAKCHLRARKLTEQRADKLISVLDNLTMIAVQVEDATSDVRILKAYESGKEILDKVLMENGMTTDRITEAMLNVQEVLDMQEEISTSLAQPLVDEDVTELEQALEELMREDKNVHQKNQAACKEARKKQLEEDVLAKLDQLTVVDDGTKPESDNKLDQARNFEDITQQNLAN